MCRRDFPGMMLQKPEIYFGSTEELYVLCTAQRHSQHRLGIDTKTWLLKQIWARNSLSPFWLRKPHENQSFFGCPPPPLHPFFNAHISIFARNPTFEF